VVNWQHAAGKEALRAVIAIAAVCDRRTLPTGDRILPLIERRYSVADLQFTRQSSIRMFPLAAPALVERDSILFNVPIRRR